MATLFFLGLFSVFLVGGVLGQVNCPCTPLDSSTLPQFGGIYTQDWWNKKQAEVVKKFPNHSGFSLKPVKKIEQRFACYIELTCDFADKKPVQNMIYLISSDGQIVTQTIPFGTSDWPRLTCNGKRQWAHTGVNVKYGGCVAVSA